MEESDEETSLAGTDAEFRQLLGLYDIPAFARRGADVEYTLTSLDARCRRERLAMLEMVHLRLRQWSAAASGPESALEVLARPLDALWQVADAPPPTWAEQKASRRRLRAVAADLIASVERFNRRWDRFLDAINFPHINRLIDNYNRFYVLEKECSLGSPRLAARHFVPKQPIERAELLAKFPLLPLPERIS
jgi:hypothetical protein